MRNKRQVKEYFILAASWFFSLISVFVLLAILVFIFQTGLSGLSTQMIGGDYYSINTVARIDTEEHAQVGNYEKPEDLPEGSYFSKKLGIALIDTKDKSNTDVVAFTYIADDSPLTHAVSFHASSAGKSLAPYPGKVLKKLTYIDADGERGNVGPFARKDAKATIEEIDARAVSVYEYSGQSQGGGIRGSIVTSVMLIAVTLIIVLPIGIAAAIWLNELAPRNKVTDAVRTGIDMLSGVPSIIFGLMGMTMLLPITRLFGIEGQSIVLGGLTMSVVLLPLVIRQTEEALKTVPVSMRMGSLSLGASQSQTIFKVVLPQAMPGIVTACLLSISRVIGESAALIYTMGTAISDSPAFHKGATTLALHIWKVMGGEQPDFEQATAISIVILVLVLLLNFSTRFILSRLNEKQSGKGKKKSEAPAATPAEA